MTNASASRVRRPVVVLAALAASMAFVAPATAERELFFEETAEAFWAVPHQCADGSTVQATLLVRSTRDFDAPDTEDPDPTARVLWRHDDEWYPHALEPYTTMLLPEGVSDTTFAPLFTM